MRALIVLRSLSDGILSVIEFLHPWDFVTIHYTSAPFTPI